MHSWQEIPDFYGYSVSDAGGVRNDRTGRLLSQAITERGVHVGLSRDRIQYTRMVARLVAEAFLDLPDLSYHRQTFTTPINRDGDRTNNHVNNLLWRPRWFAVKYHQQFRTNWGQRCLIRDLNTGDVFYSLIETAKTYGVLASEILMDSMSQERTNGVWPIGHHFEIILNNT